MKIANLVTDSGVVLKVGDRLAAMIIELWTWRKDLDGEEACAKGQIVIDFSDGSVKSALRKHSEGRRIE